MSTARLGWILALTLAVASSTRAADETAVIERATRLLEEISSNPDSGIPAGNLQDAAGIIIVPHMVETRLGLGRKKGHGVFLARGENGEWGRPEPVEISGHSAGAVAGREVTDMIIIYSTRKAAERYGEAYWKLTLGLKVLNPLRREHRFHPSFDSVGSDAIPFVRHRGLILGAAFTGEHRWGPSFAPADVKPSPTTGRKPAEEKQAAARDATAAPAPRPEAGRAGDSPETARLKEVLAAMTARPAAPNVAAKTKDAKVSPASGVQLPARPATAPR